MATNISSSLISYSKITQEPAKFNFPVNFPLKFTIESVNISYKEETLLKSITTISGILKLITPITSNLSSITDIDAQLKNSLSLITDGLKCDLDASFEIVADYDLTAIEGTTNLLSTPLNPNYNLYVNSTSAAATKSIVASTKDTDGNMASINITQTSTGNSNIQFYSNSLSLTADLEYTFSFYVYSPVTGAIIYLSLIKNGSPYTTYITQKSFTLNSGWQQVSITGSYSSSVTDARIEIMLGTCPVGIYNIYKPQLEQKSYVTKFTVGTRSEGRVIEISNLDETLTSKLSTLSNLSSLIEIDAEDYFKLNLVGNTVSNTLISGQSKSLMVIESELISNSTIAPTILNKQLLAPQIINPKSNVIGIETAIFKLITNIIANTSIAILTKNNITLDSDLSVDGNIDGNLINLIESDLIQESEINIPQTMEFPLEFPLLITDKQKITYNIEGDVVANSVMINNAITSLLSVNIESQSNINVNISCNYSEISVINSNTNINANINSQLNVASNIVSNTTINSVIINQLKEVSNVTPNSTIQGTLINNILCNSDIVSETEIDGNLYNLIESDLISITQCSKFNFPLTYPLVFGDNYIENLIHLDSDCISTVNINANITESIESDVVSSTKINGEFQADFTKYSELNSDTEINGELYKLIECNMIIETHIMQIKGFIFPLVFPLTFVEDINRLIELESNLTSTSEIKGDLVKLVSSDLKSNTTIKNISVLEFPLKFPFAFNGIFDDICLDCDFDSSSQTTGEVQLLIFSNVSSSSQIGASTSNNIAIKSLVEVEFKINDVISDTTQISSNISANSVISGAITRTNKLTGCISSNSNLNASLKNNIGLVENFISNSNINAKISNLHFIMLKCTFIKNSKSTEIFNVKRYISSVYTDCSYMSSYNENVAETVNISNIEEQTEFNINKVLTVQPFSVNANLLTVSDIFETVIFITKISSSEQIKTYEETKQFGDISYKNKI